MKQSLIILLPGKPSLKFVEHIKYSVEGFSYCIVSSISEMPNLQNKKILWAVELDQMGFNLALEKMLIYLGQQGQTIMKDAIAGIIIQTPSEIGTKSTAYRIIFQTNQLGCRYMGHPVVEATRDLVNFLSWQKQLQLPLVEIYRKRSLDLVQRLIKYDPPRLKKPRVLVLYSNPRKTSNTLMLWNMVKYYFPKKINHLKERHVENGTIVDCRGCLYKTCRHYSEKRSCFYGGIVVQEILPAIERADFIIWLCPNYNDSVSAKLMAVINRMTVLYRRVNLNKKTFFAIIVSGSSGSENVAMQLIGALNVNKGIQLPPKFTLMATANDPGAIKQVAFIREKANNFAVDMYREMFVLNAKNIFQKK